MFGFASAKALFSFPNPVFIAHISQLLLEDPRGCTRGLVVIIISNEHAVLYWYPLLSLLDSSLGFAPNFYRFFLLERLSFFPLHVRINCSVYVSELDIGHGR